MDKIILKDYRPVKEIELPSYKGSRLLVYPSLLVSDMMSGIRNTNEIQFSLDSLVKLIKSWNFVDENQKELPITSENVGILNVSDLEFLMKEITAFALEVKKN